MKKFITLFLSLSCLFTLAACSKANNESTQATISNTESIAITEAETQNEVLNYFASKYNMAFRLYGPEGHDLYVFHIYPDYAEWECHILMPANTDDIAEFQKDLSWEVVDDELIISGAGSQETFKIDITTETATSTTNGRVYRICEKDEPLE